MNRRSLLIGSAISVLPFSRNFWAPDAQAAKPRNLVHRVRPSDRRWPSSANWQKLNRDVGGQLTKVRSPLEACANAPGSTACADVFKALKNPYYIGDEAGLTETLGWVDGWTFRPSAYAIAARKTSDVVAAVNFARTHNLRLVVKGGGHSYQGTSNAADSLLIWTRKMNAITLHDAFVAKGCERAAKPRKAVTLGAGAIWMHAYNRVTTEAGRYVQGGGCATVGVAGLVQSGGFGSFSKNFGTAAASLIEAEVVTADGAVRIANACTNPELFWGIKGGGGGSLGVVTRLTLQTHDLPDFFGGVSATIKATSDAAFRRLIGLIIGFYSERLFNPRWGEQIVFRRGNAIAIKMVFQGLGQQQAENIWRPVFDKLTASPQGFHLVSKPHIIALPARHFWDPGILKKLPGIVREDNRPNAPEGNVFWAGDQGETGQFLHGYQSAWLPASLLQKGRQERLAEALFAATRHWDISLHFNKGLAGAPAAAVAASKATAMNPAVLDAFALAICAGGGPPAYPGIASREPNLTAARKHADAIESAMNEMRKLLTNVGSYVSEGNFFDERWRQSYWGPNYPRLLAVKKKYDPGGLFFVHHGVGSEAWSADGFTRLR